MKTFKLILSALVLLFTLTQCKDDNEATPTIYDPDTAAKVSVDRFSSDFGTLFVRTATNGLPEANASINFDQPPFITQGFGPGGEIVKYYNLDVLPLTSAPIFAFFYEGSDTPVDGQLNIIDVIPGETEYNDFWHVHKVTVPDNYVANTIASLDDLMSVGYTITKTDMLVNCPVVPAGSTANLRFNASESKSLTRAWYKKQVVFYFTFEEKQLTVALPTTGHPTVPISEILVSFNINPDQAGGGPPSGFMMETGSDQTHNVVQTIPTDASYSPFWDVDIYDNADFASVSDWVSASSSNILVTGAALVNCPVVSVQ